MSSTPSEPNNSQDRANLQTDDLKPIKTAPTSNSSSLAKIPSKSQTKRTAKLSTALVGAAVMLPILAVGTVTYYFGSKAIDRQEVLVERTDTTGLTAAELVRQQQLLETLLLGTGTTALLAGAVAVWAKRRFNLVASEKATITQPFPQPKPIQIADRSIPHGEIFNALVRETRNYLNCDRVVIYSLSQDYGKVIAESVASSRTQLLGKIFEDNCFDAKYLNKYRNSKVRVINNVNEAELSECYLEQLELLEVKASLVTPIFNEGKLFGLSIAHQCSNFRQWQEEEIEFFNQQAKKASLALDNSKLSENLTRLQQQIDKEREWTNYFSDATHHIRQSLKQKDILNISVEEVRQALKCDRVVVYSLNEDRYGTVIAESVAAGWTRALGKVIKDPCFGHTYREKYLNGRVRALNNIYESGLTRCYIELLEELEVKANLVTPIINEGKLFGLLVAHQCSASRTWQEYEIRWVTQISTQVGFALDNAKVLADSTKLQQQADLEKQWTQYFIDAVQHIRQSHKQEDLLDISVEKIRQALKCDRVLVYSLNKQNYGVVTAESVAPGWTRALGKTIEDPCFEALYFDKYRDGRIRVINNIDEEANLTQCYLEQLSALEVKANLITPILNEGNLFGLLVAQQCSAPRTWQEHEIRWQTQIAIQVGFALDNAQLWQQLKREGIPTQPLKNFTLSIRQSSNKEELLKTAVEQARKIMELDRVVVYQFDADWYGTVVAESVIPPYPQALRSRLKDPCFARDYAEKYRNGRVKAIADIYQAGLTNCHIEQLKAFAVKASIVAPVMQNERLFGLFIGHQCSQPRFWEQTEIELFAQLALQFELALDRAILKERSQSTTKVDKQLKLLEPSQNIVNKSPQIGVYSLESQQQNPNIERQKIQLNETIAEASAKVEHLNQSYQNLYRMVSSIEELKKRIPPQQASISTDLEEPTISLVPEPPLETSEEITVEANEVIDTNAIDEINNELEPNFEINSTIEPEKSTIEPDSAINDEFTQEIANLTERVSQQSAAVTDSFEKLTEFAQKLSKDSDKPKTED